LPLSPLNKQSFVQSTQSFTPKGKTPLSASLDYTAKSFKNNDANNNIVLISDGIETCGGDPCETIKRLRGQEGVNVNVHVIGFDVDDEAQAQLQCIAEAGEGKYITATSNEGFEDAFTQVTQEVQVKEEEFKAKQKPVSTRHVETGNVIYETSFADDFSQEDWTIALENPMFHSIDESGLNLAGDQALQNIFVLNRPLPEGDWQATAQIRFSVQTGDEVFRLGLFQDGRNYLFSQVDLKGGSEQEIVGAFRGQFSGGREHTSDVRILGLDFCRDRGADGKFLHDRHKCWKQDLPLKKFLKDNIGYIKFVKEGKLLKAFAKFEYEFEHDWILIGEFPLLKPFGQIAFHFNSGSPAISMGVVEHFKIEALNITE